MRTSGLSDMYTQGLKAAAGPRAEGVHIRQTKSAHDIAVMYIPWPLLLGSTAQARNLIQ